MDQLGSPDLPAYICYLLVCVIGLLVARSQVNRLLAPFPQRWGFLSTWGLFWVQAGVPVVLFWFLDYSEALRDTSLFAALLVAFGYRQIFVGGVDSIRLPGQTQRLWQPFESWVKQLVEHITGKLKSDMDRFNDRVSAYVASEGERIKALAALAFLHTFSPPDLEKGLEALATEKPPSGVSDSTFQEIQNRKRVTLLLNDLRSSAGDNYGYFLYQRGVVPRIQYLLWFGNVRSRGIAWGATGLLAAVLALGAYFASQSVSVQSWYYRWRFTKSNSSEPDRFRSRRYFEQQLRAAGDNPAHFEAVLTPMLVKLRFKDMSNEVAEDILRLVVYGHNSRIDTFLFPQLTASLRTDNPDIRLRVQRTLLDLYHADYCTPAESSLETTPKGWTCKPEVGARTASWVPTKDESSGTIDSYVRSWQTWWEAAQQAAGTHRASAARVP